MTGEGDLLQADAENIVAEVSGTRVVRATVVDEGVMTFKYFVESAAGQQYVVRFYPPTREWVVRYEPDVVRLCRNQGMRVAEVIASSLNGPPARLNYMVYCKIPGMTLQALLASLSPGTLSRISTQLIEELLVLSEIKIDGFGDLVDSRRARFDSWSSFVSLAFSAGLPFVWTHGLLPPRTIEGIESIGRNLDRFTFAGQPSLCWGDISLENIIVSEGAGLVGLVDFEGVLGAEFDLNLGYLRARYEGTSFYTSLANSWPRARDQATSARSALYVIVRALRLALNGREPLPTGVERDPLERFLPGLDQAVHEALRWIDERSPALHP